jgi:hypothetical protein
MAKEAEAIFKQIDTDDSGSLDMREMHNKLSDFGLSEEQIEQIFFGASHAGSKLRAQRSHTRPAAAAAAAAAALSARHEQRRWD